MKRGMSFAALIVATAAMSGSAQAVAPRAHAAPAPEVEYLYNVTVRRHYNFPNAAEALNYGYEICGKVSRGDSYAQLADAVRNDMATSDEFAVSYLISYAVNLLCPAEIWQLRNSAANYRPPVG